ncbi:MAG TPA: RsiV family protein [Bacteroidia bacterium]|jgi:hypothetical protein|nr:RsiV family protein [Bacteroidia bacterium]
MKTCIKILTGLLIFLPISSFAYFAPGDILYLSGSIDTFRIEMTLHFNEQSQQFDGHYHYAGMNSWLALRGSYDEQNKVVLEEFPYQHNVVCDKSSGKFTGDLSPEDMFVGTWTNPKGTKVYRFTLIREDKGNGMSFSGGYDRSDSTTGEYTSTAEIHYVRPYSDATQLQDQLDSFIFNRLFYPDGFTVEINSTKIKPVYPEFTSITSAYVNANASAEFSSEWDAGVDVVWNGSGVLCMSNGNWEYAGGAHGVGFSEFNCFDLKTGKKIEEKDIFLKGYEETLRRKAIEHLDREEGELFLPKDSLELNGNFYLTPEGIGYFYNSYEITSYAGGTPETFIPWSELNSLIDPKGPMGWVKK